MSNLLTIGSDHKTILGERFGYRTAVQYLQPGDESGTELCAGRSCGCFEKCISRTGRMPMSAARMARAKRTALYLLNPTEHLAQLTREVELHVRAADRAGLIPCVRLNGTSDVDWTRKPHRALFKRFPDLQFYDYCKVWARVRRFARGELPANYHLTWSRSETNHRTTLRAMDLGVNIAVVFRRELPTTWHGRPVVSGDESDLRFLDPCGVVVGLKAKGPARRDTTGFVVD